MTAAARVDVVILTALPLELDAVLAVDAGAVAGSVWERDRGPSGLPVAFRSFVVGRGRPLRVAVALAPDMGATAAVNTLLPLVDELAPRCIAMCGVCAGRRGKVQLGDVVAADRLYYHDTGKQLPDRVQQDLTTYKLRDDWKAALEGMDPVARFADRGWFQARPLPTEWRLYRALVALRDGIHEPWNAVDPAGGVGEWPLIVAALRERGLLAKSGRELTGTGQRFVDDLLFRHRGRLPDLSPVGAATRFRLHVAPIGSGARVIEDEAIWSFVSAAMRKTLGLEMEAAALGELAHRQRQHRLDAVVMKGVMDFADHGRDDHFQQFAARASAECLVWFLRENVATEAVAGFDDVLAPGTLPVPGRTPAPSVLLDARYGVVPWHDAGRTEVLADLDAWADDPSRGVDARLIHAEGGVGKTRLAIEWVRRRRERYDVAGFLLPGPDPEWFERLCGLGAPVLIVIDYAESRADLVAVLQRAARLAASQARHRARFLLLARNAGDWWHALLQRDPAIAVLFADREPLELSPLAVTAAERAAVFSEALTVFAAARHRPHAPGPRVALDDARFQRVLYLHMAALAEVEATRPALDASSLMNRILEHEERFWIREASDRAGAAVAVPLARQLVAAATLRGGLTSDEARELCVRLAQRPRTDHDDALIALLHDIYDAGDPACYLPGLAPDLLGEALVLRVGAPPGGAGAPAGGAWIDHVVVTGDRADVVTTAFTVLGRASAISPGAVRSWIARLLGHELPTRAVLALRAEKAVGLETASSALGDLLADALERDGTVVIARELAKEEIPHPTVSLRRVAEWQLRTRLAHIHADDDHHALAERAELLVEHGVRLRDLGQLEPALAAMREAVQLLRMFATRYPEAFQPALARGLHSLGRIWRELGQLKKAHAATSEAVKLQRALARRDPALEPDLAQYLVSLGNRLSDLGQHRQALLTTHEVVEPSFQLAMRDPEFTPDLVNVLSNLGTRLGEAGLYEEAFAACRDAVTLCRQLALIEPDGFEPELAKLLTNLGARLSDLGRHEPALATASEAVVLCRALAARAPGAFEPELARSLSSLGSALRAMRQHRLALDVTREAVELWRSLAASRPDTFQAELAESLTNLGNSLGDLGEHEAALAAADEAIDLRRALAAHHPKAYQPDLAVSLTGVARALSALGDAETATTAAAEAVNIYCDFKTQVPKVYEPDLARSLTTLSVALDASDRHDAALAVICEAVALYRDAAARHPERFEPDLAEALRQLTLRLAAVGQYAQAASACRETCDLFLRLAKHEPELLQSDLAMDLNDLALRLSMVHCHHPALAAARQAVAMSRTLAVRHPDVFQPQLADSLLILGELLSEQGRYNPAVATVRQAVRIYRKLAKRAPDVFQIDLLECLTSLGLMLHASDERKPAIAVGREAMQMFHAQMARGVALDPSLADDLLQLEALSNGPDRRPWTPNGRSPKRELRRRGGGRSAVSRGDRE